MRQGKQNPEKRTEAIRKYCLWCCVDQHVEVLNCPAFDCPLYHFRLSRLVKEAPSYREKANIEVFSEPIVAELVISLPLFSTVMEMSCQCKAVPNRASFGNFINAPLWGRSVPLGKTVFIDPLTLKPYSDQWAFLKSIKRVGEQILDDIIEINDLCITETRSNPTAGGSTSEEVNRFSLPPCAQKMLRDGVSQYQRISCFRLAVHLKRLGLPFDVAVAALKVLSYKNRPKDNKQVITERKIIDQISYAYKKNYRGFGCNSQVVNFRLSFRCLIKPVIFPIKSMKIRSILGEPMELSDNIELLTVEAYAKRFCVSRTTVFEWKKNGILIPGRHYIKIARTLRFVWCSEIIGDLHESNAQDTENKKKQTINSTMSKKVTNKKSTINMEY